MLGTSLENQSWLDVVAHTDNPTTQEEEIGQPEVQAQTWLHSKFKTTLVYMRSCQQERRRGAEKEAKRDKKMRQKLPAEGALTAKLVRWRQPWGSMGSLGVTAKRM